MGNMCSTPTTAEDPAPKPATTQQNEVAKAAPPAPATEAAPKVEAPPPAAEAANSSPAPAEEKASPAPEPSQSKKLKVFVIFYSTYGHIYKLAETYKAALETVPDVEVSLFQVSETLPKEVLEKMHAAPKPDVPIADPHKLPEADAIVFGFPTRFGMMASQMKSFFDATGMLWQNGALHGKPVSMFTSTATQGGGQETTLMTAVTQLAHHGMIYVPTGYAAGNIMFGVEEAKGGSPWGAGTLAGPDGSRQPSEVELEALKVQATVFAGIAKKLAA